LSLLKEKEKRKKKKRGEKSNFPRVEGREREKNLLNRVKEKGLEKERKKEKKGVKALSECPLSYLPHFPIGREKERRAARAVGQRKGGERKEKRKKGTNLVREFYH